MYKSDNFEILIEKNLTDLCIKAANISNGDVVKQHYYSWAKNSYIEWYSKIFNINIPLDDIEEKVNILCENIELGIAPKHLLINSYNQPMILEDYLKSLDFNVFLRLVQCRDEIEEYDKVLINLHDYFCYKNKNYKI